MAQRPDPERPTNIADFSSVDFYAWRVGWATAHILPGKCVAAFMERPAAWGVERIYKVTKAAIKRRGIQLCVRCAQGLVEGRMSAQYADTLRQQRLAARGVTTYAAVDKRRRRA